MMSFLRRFRNNAGRGSLLLSTGAIVLMFIMIYEMSAINVRVKKGVSEKSFIEVRVQVPTFLKYQSSDSDIQGSNSSTQTSTLPSLLTSTKAKSMNQSLVGTGNATTLPPSGIGANGAWWLDTKAPEYGHAFDVALCQALEDLFEGEDVLDLGTGLGHYGRCFLRMRDPMFPGHPGIDQQFFDGINRLNQSGWWNTTQKKVKSWTGYDGSPNVENVTNGFVKHMDLTNEHQDFGGKTWDWVMSLEVGEHIPAQFEDIFISNVIKPVEHKLLLSWAVRGQGGRSHINELNNTEVVDRLSKKGFVEDAKKSKNLRRRATAYWFKKSLMVFIKQHN